MTFTYRRNMIDGLSYTYLKADELKPLLPEVERLDFTPEPFLGKLTNRAMSDFGFKYKAVGRELLPAPPFPDWLVMLEATVRACFALSTSAPFQQCIVTRYLKGAGIGWHCDAPRFGHTICGVSLGAPGRLQLRSSPVYMTEDGVRKKVELPMEYELVTNTGCVYSMSGTARWNCQHRIVAVKDTRYSLTFRTVNYARGVNQFTKEPEQPGEIKMTETGWVVTKN